MSYNDPTDPEALTFNVTPPAATPVGVRGTSPQPIPADPLPNSIAAPPTPVAVPSATGAVVGGQPVASPSSPPTPIQTQRSASVASAQLVPVSPTQPPVIVPVVQTATVAAGAASGVTATSTFPGATVAPQTPATTTPGTTVQS